jgi:hypothetical protein
VLGSPAPQPTKAGEAGEDQADKQSVHR